MTTVLPWKEGPFQSKKTRVIWVQKEQVSSKLAKNSKCQSTAGVWNFTFAPKTLPPRRVSWNPAAFVKSPRAWGMWVTVLTPGKTETRFSSKGLVSTTTQTAKWKFCIFFWKRLKWVFLVRNSQVWEKNWLVKPEDDHLEAIFERINAW